MKIEDGRGPPTPFTPIMITLESIKELMYFKEILSAASKWLPREPITVGTNEYESRELLNKILIDLRGL